MRSSSRSKILLGGFAAVIVLAIAGSLFYGVKKKHDLESSATASAADATARLREAAGTALDAPQAADRLQTHADALALKERAERDNFDYRTALGALAALYRAHRDSQDKLRAAAPGTPFLEEAARARLHQAAKDAEVQAEQDLEQLRRLPIG